MVDEMEWVNDKSDLRGDFVLSEEELRSSSTSLSCPTPSESSSMTTSRQPEMELSAVDDQDVLRVSSCS